MDLAAYLAPEGFVEQLTDELGPAITASYGRLLLAKAVPSDPIWVQNIWRTPQYISFSSIGDAVKKLRGLQRNWTLYPHTEHRRAALIAQQLPRLSSQPLTFPTTLPQTPMGSWMLLDRNTLLASPLCSSTLPDGEFHFRESPKPPSRAYLKLWEALTRLQSFPTPGQKCLEIGASPGSWTWVLQQCGADVVAVDRAALAAHIASLPKVSVVKGDAFTMTPEKVGPIDWLFSDVICYPEKLLEFVLRWLDSGLCSRFVCTLKFQEGADYAIAKAFAALPGSQVVHLYYNKHELTWICQR